MNGRRISGQAYTRSPAKQKDSPKRIETNIYANDEEKILPLESMDKNLES